jgi:KDO2-lipid IV(A) lauroyltransferase
VPSANGSRPTDRLWADAYRLGSALARHTPERLAVDLPRVLGPIFAAAMPGRRRMIERHQQRVHEWTLKPAERREAAVRAFESYARYWLESFRLPDVPADVLARHFEVLGWEHVEAGLDAGRGVILALPHLGGWEWAGFWVTRVQQVGMTVVVEPIDPPELFEWFREFREQLGMKVVPLGPQVAGEVSRALSRNDVVCLLCDRDLVGTGVETEFFGETTTLPGGPVTLGLRGGVPVLPTAVYFRGRRDHLGYIGPPLQLERRGRLRDDVAAGTAVLAGELEMLIRRAPEQWHLFQPNWPSDHRLVATTQQRRGLLPLAARS